MTKYDKSQLQYLRVFFKTPKVSATLLIEMVLKIVSLSDCFSISLIAAIFDCFYSSEVAVSRR